MKAGTLLLATRSAGKLAELRALFSGSGLELADPDSLGLVETREELELEKYETFEENAVAKARYFHHLTRGLPTVADDSGLCVDVLGGKPGVKSKRWADRLDLTGQALDDANNAKLIRELTHIELRGRGRAGSAHFPFPARYVCVAVYADATGEIIRRGETTGVIVRVPRGTGGFGYDPYFESEAVGGTFAEATIEQKEAVSHRGRAFRALAAALRDRHVI